MPAYQMSDADMTLREALAGLRAAEGDVSEALSTDLAAALVAHDVVHILFGLDISDLDEVVAHAWMVFGTTPSNRELHSVMRHRDHRRLTSSLRYGRRLQLVLRALPRPVGAALRARRMRTPWP
jgi:hypothetical protein